MIRFHEPYVTGRELDYIKDVFATRHFGGDGPYTRKCHQFLKDRYGVPGVFLTHSCTGALEMAALGLNLEPGDEVILPSYTFCATATAFLRVGARLVFCEIDPDTMMMDAADAAARVTGRTRAIVPVHYAGVAADMGPVMDLAQRHGFEVVEDAAQGLEASLDGKPLGTFGRFGCLSFHETKNIHAGLTGALFVNREDDIERLTYIWERGTDRQRMLGGHADKYTWVDVGSSFYPAEMQAAFLLAQLEAVEDNLAERQAIGAAYDAGLAPLKAAGHFSVGRVDPGRSVNRHAVFIVLNTPAERERVRAALAEAGVDAVTHYEPLHASPMGARLGYRPEELPLTLDFAARLLRLPMHNNLTIKDVQSVCAHLADCF